MIDPALLRDYNRIRRTRDKSLICHAPFVSLNFEQNGNATACCYNRKQVLGTYPKDSIMDMWLGKPAQELREFIKTKDLGGGCEMCGQQLKSRNFHGTRARGFDEFADYTPIAAARKLGNYLKTGRYLQMPKLMEFEMSNTCNLECVMCNGYFSSSIRKNREQLPATPNPYDEGFVNQLDQFIPHLTDARFLGGEPFLIDIYYPIWEHISKLNPAMRLHITTNATVLNKRVKDLIEDLNVHFVISIDSLIKENYEAIRLNAKFERVMENWKYFYDYTRRKKTNMSFAVCPFTMNWQEMPAITEFCNKHGIQVYFNTVIYPRELSLETMDKNELRSVVEFLDAANLPGTGYVEAYNKRMYVDMVNQVKAWAGMLA